MPDNPIGTGLEPIDDPAEQILGEFFHGDLQVLATWIEDGGALTPALRDELVDVIRSGALDKAYKDYCFPPISQAEENAEDRYDRDLSVGAWIAVRNFMTKRGSYARILASAAATFGVSEGTAKRCHLDFRQQHKRARDSEVRPSEGLRPGDDHFMARHLWWKALKSFCEERGLDYHEVHTQLYSVKTFDLDF